MAKWRYVSGAFVAVVVACQPAPKPAPKDGDPAPLEAGREEVSAEDSDAAECSDAGRTVATTRDPSGYPAIVVQHPAAWKVVVPAAGRLQLMPPAQDFQVIASAFAGPSQTDNEVRQLDENSIGNYPIVKPWQKVEARAEYRVFSVTRQTPQTLIELTYYVGEGGLVVVSVESPGPLQQAAQREWQRLLQCIQVSFS